jgi:transcription antitermination factor NusG
LILELAATASRPHLSGNGEALSSILTTSEVLGHIYSSATPTLDWFAAYTYSCQERRVAQHLFSREIEYFLPIRRHVRRWKNGCKVQIERPLFPGYVFVRIDRVDRVRVLELPGVHSIVGTGREPSPLPIEQIDMLRQGLELRNPEPHPFLTVGERARICRGPLAGMTGIVIRRKNGLRLVVSLELIMKSVSVEVEEQDLQALGPWHSHRRLLSGHADSIQYVFP